MGVGVLEQALGKIGQRTKENCIIKGKLSIDEDLDLLCKSAFQEYMPKSLLGRTYVPTV